MPLDPTSFDPRSWRRFAITLVAVAAVALAAMVAVAYAVDPYDTGRSTLFDKPGVGAGGARRGRARWARAAAATRRSMR
jgi:hypothetical protein